VRKDGGEESKIKRGVGIGEDVLARFIAPSLIIDTVVYIGQDKAKIAETRGDLTLAPGDTIWHDIEPIVGALLAQKGSKWNRHAANPAADIEDSITRF